MKAGVRTENIAIAGHSLGSHVAGFTGKLLIDNGHKLSRIYGNRTDYDILFRHNHIFSP